ncbi:IclR family transcriptional regulator [Pelagibius sp. Alg239-R121]|uniref:IclR family transcriptional regulator n=1 Tax=Pelagibius sp. Alg239-R121 TaxID=2993448 RepID=UPI0024A625FE|nr:IclR family transcriptional regulator [Pelagibius sp. Alg239-R121]
MNNRILGTQSFSRSIAVLQLISERDSPSVSDLLKLCDLTRPTLYRILASLEAEGLIQQTSDKRYRLGARLVGLAHKALAQMDLRSLARPSLEMLRDDTGETVHLAVRNREQMIYIDKIESREVVRMASTIGTPVPFHSSSVGKAYLSAMPHEDALALLDRLPLDAVTDQTNTDRDRLKRFMIRADELGYAYDDQENEKDIVCFGAAIRDVSGGPVAAVSVSVPLFRLRDDRRFYWRALLRHTAEISARLGYSDLLGDVRMGS